MRLRTASMACLLCIASKAIFATEFDEKPAAADPVLAAMEKHVNHLPENSIHENFKISGFHQMGGMVGSLSVYYRKTGDESLFVLQIVESQKAAPAFYIRRNGCKQGATSEGELSVGAIFVNKQKIRAKYGCAPDGGGHPTTMYMIISDRGNEFIDRQLLDFQYLLVELHDGEIVILSSKSYEHFKAKLAQEAL